MNPVDFGHADAGQHADSGVQTWLRKAAGDLELARRELATAPAPNYDAVCYHAPQGVEKLMKACLLHRGVSPPRIHDLVHLDSLIGSGPKSRTWTVLELSELSSAAVEARYPGHESTHDEAARAIELASRVWNIMRSWV